MLGIDVQRRDFEVGMPSYLRGRWQDRGWWYYYLYGLTIKVPLGTWALLILALVLMATFPAYRASWRDELVLLVPAAVVLVLVSSQTGFSHHFRYVLPVLPFAFIWISKAAISFSAGPRLAAIVTAAALAWLVISSLLVYPHSLSYFNELVGGPEGGHDHMIDSPIDWGQDLIYLKQWLDEHPTTEPIHLAYFGDYDPEVAGIEFTLPPKEPAPGWFAISVSMLRGRPFSIFDGRGGREGILPLQYAWFQHFEPIDRAGYSIYIYHITPQEADGVRRQLGFPNLPGKAL